MNKSKLIGAVVILLLLGTVMVGAGAATAAANSLNSISLGEDFNLNAGDSVNLKVITDPEETELGECTWLSDNTTVATVDSSGIVTGVSAGTAVITVSTTYGGKDFQAHCTATVQPAAGYTVTYVSTTYESGINATWYDENTYNTEIKPNATIQTGVSSGTGFTVTYYPAENAVQISSATTTKNIYLGYNGAKFTGTPKISVSLDGAEPWHVLNVNPYEFSVSENTGIYLKVENGSFLTIASPNGVTLVAYVNGGEDPITSVAEVTPGNTVVIKPTVTAEKKSIKTMDIKNTCTSAAFGGSITKDVNGWYNFTMPDYSITVSCILTGGGTSTVTYEADPTYTFTIPSDITLRSVVNGKVGTPASIAATSDFSSDKKIVMRLDTKSDAVTTSKTQTNFAVHSTDVAWDTNGKYAEYTMAVYDDEGLTTKQKDISDNQTTTGAVNNIIVEVTGEGGSAQQAPSVSKYVGFTTTVLPLIVDADYTGTLTFTVSVEQTSS